MPSVKDIPDLTDEEEARVQAAIARDPDNPEITDEQITLLRPAREVLHPDLYAALRRERQHPESREEQEQVTIPLDRAVVDHFRAAGPEWPSLINEALKKAIGGDAASDPSGR